MHRFRQLLTRRFLQQQGSFATPSSGGSGYQPWIPLQRELSLSCPSLTSWGNGRGDNPGSGDGDGDNPNPTSPAPVPTYHAISDMLNVTTKKSREDAASGEKEKPTSTSTSTSSTDPTPIVTFASGPHGTTRSGVIMGIETSCDDTGVAVINTDKKILGEALNSQLQIHLNHGGIIPPVAKHLHEQHIVRIIKEAMTEAKVTVHDLDAIATTVKPGLPLSLLVGMKHAKQLCLQGNKPFIPIHHMKAHALTCRMLEDIEFPYMVLLISGAHCLLVVAKSIDHFEILGTTIDDAPGEAFDKTARRLKLHNLPEGSSLAGGEAIEFYAKKGNPEAFKFPTPMYKYRDCNWSFAGLKFSALRHILHEERAHKCDGPDVIPTYADLCASFQYAVVAHLCKKIQRGIIYANTKNLIPEQNRVLVVSGGVACNEYVKRGLDLIGKEMNYRILCPSKKLCTDNGVMIAWNGVEKWKAGIDIIPSTELDSVDIEAKSPMGESLQTEIRQMDIKCHRIKMTQLFIPDPGTPPEKAKNTS